VAFDLLSMVVKTYDLFDSRYSLVRTNFEEMYILKGKRSFQFTIHGTGKSKCASAALNPKKAEEAWWARSA
jgi:hypothetical protein